MNINRIVILSMSIIVITSLGSCEKFLDVGSPEDKIIAKDVFNSNASSTAALTAMYPDFYFTIVSPGLGVNFSLQLAADEFELYDQDNFVYSGFYKNNNLNSDFFWNSLYGFIYRVNAAIEGLSESKLLSERIQRQLLGEAKFLRAFYYYYLINLYGDVPLLVSSSYKINLSAPRSSVTDVYNQIIMDLKDAKGLLTDAYVNEYSTGDIEDRIRPNKWAAAALLSRVYLYMKDWGAAEKEADDIINTKALYDTVALSTVFLKNNKEAIWELQPINTVGYNTLDGRMYVLVDGPDGAHPVYSSGFILEAFERNDSRQKEWIGVDSSRGDKYFFPFKYKRYKEEDPDEEYYVVLRLAEQYLIRAEARGMQGDLEGASADLNVIRKRARLGEVKVTSETGLIEAILHERQIEFYTEGGHRWFDLKRLGYLNEVMVRVAPIKGADWLPFKQLFPIPIPDLRLNPNLIQNPGYNS